MSLSDSFGQVSILAEFVDGIAVVGGPEVFIAGDDVGMFQPFDNVQFSPKKLFNSHFLDLLELHDLNCNLCALLKILSLIHFGKGTLSYL
jgi:hypothetical protein